MPIMTVLPPTPLTLISKIFFNEGEIQLKVYTFVFFSVIKLERRIEISFLRKYPENKACGDM